MTGRIEMVFTEENGKTHMSCDIDICASTRAKCMDVAQLSKNLEITGKDWAKFVTEIEVARMIGVLDEN